jgi:predicted Zn-dependent protease with MMP-like domain
MSTPIEPPKSPRPASGKRIALSALIALSLGLVVVVVAEGFSASGPLRTIEQMAIGLVVIAAFLAIVAFAAVGMAGWHDPQSEQDFDELVLRAERLAGSGLAPPLDPAERAYSDLNPLDDHDFDELVRDALDDLPDLLRNALGHVAIMVSDDGASHRAYGLYQGDGATRDNYPDRVIIFRDTLRRDFGHDADLLRAQVTRTVRHELAHHVGFDELGVSRLDL